MKSYEAFAQTLDEFNITNRSLHLASGVSESSISRFRRGKQNLSTDDLDAMIAALEEEPRQFFYSLLLGELSDGAIANILYAISLKIRSGNSSDELLLEKIPA